MPTNDPNPFQYDGAIHGDSRRIINQTFEQCILANTTSASATNPQTATNLMTGTVKGGTLARVGQSLQIFAMGVVNLVGLNPKLTITVTINSVTLLTITTDPIWTDALNHAWQLNAVCTVATVDALGKVTLECHGSLSQNLTGSPVTAQTYQDTNVAVSSSVNAAIDQTLAVTASLSQSNAASVVTQRQLIVVVYN